jgi:hypothetical protein
MSVSPSFRSFVLDQLAQATPGVRWYQAIYTVAAPLSPVLHGLFPQVSTTTAILGRALSQVAAVGYSKPILYSRDINALGTTA